MTLSIAWTTVAPRMAIESRDFLRRQARIMAHRHSAERENIEDEKKRRPTIMETAVSIAVIAHPTLSRDVKADLLRKPIRRPDSRKPTQR